MSSLLLSTTKMKLRLSLTFVILCISWGWVNSAVVRPQDLIVRNSTSNTEAQLDSKADGLSSRNSPKTSNSTSPGTTAKPFPKVDGVLSRNPTTTTTLPRTTKKTSRFSSTTTTASPVAITTRRRIPNLFNNPTRNTTILQSRPRVAREVTEETEDDSKSEEDSVEKIGEENHSSSPEDKKTLTADELKSSEVEEARANPTATPVTSQNSETVIPEIIVPESPAKLDTVEEIPEISAEEEKEATEPKHFGLSATPHSISKRSLSTLIPLLSSLGIPATLTLLAQAFLAPIAALVLGLLGGIGSSWWLGQLPFLDRFNPFALPPKEEDEYISARSSRNLNINARNIVSAIESGYKLWQNVQKNEI